MTTTSDNHVLQDGDRQVTFDGDLIASASSECEGKDRWSEMFIYVDVSDDSYVVYGVGRSSLPGETDRGWVRKCHTADAVITVLTRKSNDVSYMPNLNVRLLERAGMIDDAIHAAASTQAL